MKYIAGILLITLLCGCSTEVAKEPKEVKAATEEKSSADIKSDLEEIQQKLENQFLKYNTESIQEIEGILQELTTNLLLIDFDSPTWEYDMNSIESSIGIYATKIKGDSELMDSEREKNYSETIANLEVISFRMKILESNLNEALDAYDTKALDKIRDEDMPPLNKLITEVTESMEKERQE